MRNRMSLEQLKNLIKWGLTAIIWPLGPRQPSLEELLEFARTVVPAMVLSDIGERGWYVYQKGTPNPPDAMNLDPKQAVYKLLEKILGDSPNKRVIEELGGTAEPSKEKK